MKRLALVSLIDSQVPIGLTYLASWLTHHNPDWVVSIIDSGWCDPFQKIMASQWDYIGISSMTITYEKATQLAKSIKSAGCQTPIVLGGTHITALPESMRPEFDVLIPGEGELALSHFLKTGEVKPFERLSLEDYPDLRFDLLDYRWWNSQFVMFWRGHVKMGLLLTSRGCAFRCRFCATSAFWKGITWHKASWVVRQIQALTELGCTHISLWDDLITVNKPRLREMAVLFEKAGLRSIVKSICVQGRAEVTDAETCDLLRSMNVGPICYGIETGSDRLLSYLKKGKASTTVNVRAIKLARQHGLKPLGTLMLGNPTETVGDIFKTILFIIRAALLGCYDLVPFISTPLPGTEFWEIAKARGRVSSRMNFDDLAIHTKAVGEAMLLDIPRWQFCLLWPLVLLSLALFKAKKAVQIIFHVVRHKLVNSQNTHSPYAKSLHTTRRATTTRTEMPASRLP